MKIKVCGITTVEQMQRLQELGVDYAGMIFYEGSKRFVRKAISHQTSAIRSLTIPRVGVFVNAEMSVIEQAIRDYGLTAVQLHGDETDEFCLELMDKVKVIKVFRIADTPDIDTLVAPFQEVCHYYLFDTLPPAPLLKERGDYGGTGLQFNWEVLERAVVGKPFFLSGGIGLEDVDKVKAFHHPYLYAIDVNSRFEITPGVKDLAKVAQFRTMIGGDKRD